MDFFHQPDSNFTSKNWQSGNFRVLCSENYCRYIWYIWNKVVNQKKTIVDAGLPKVPSISLGLPELPSGVKQTKAFTYTRRNYRNYDFTLGEYVLRLIESVTCVWLISIFLPLETDLYQKLARLGKCCLILRCLTLRGATTFLRRHFAPSILWHHGIVKSMTLP